MELFTNTELADMRPIYGLAEGNAQSKERLYRDPHRDAPDRLMFASLYHNLCEYGSLRVQNLRAVVTGLFIVFPINPLGESLESELSYFISNPVKKKPLYAD
ncbi:hypothetical protein TNCV_4463391 [Trichonephila clavipes]|nr:hypothetical protein TNCV_4463391 [Trichonephila clavipes]